jgi:spermidine synthase
VLLAAPYALGDRVAFLALSLQGLDAIGFGGLVLEWGIVTSVVVMPAALVAGYQFPLLVAVVGQGQRRVGREVGLTYASNTLGAIAGAVAGGFGLLPLLTAPGTWRWTAMGLAVLAGAALLVDRLRHRDAAPWRRSGAVAPVALLAIGAVLLAAAPGPTAFWRHSGIGGRRADRDFGGPNDVRALMRADRARLIWEAEGRESSVSLIQGHGYTFMVNGKTDGSALGDAPTQILSGMIGSMLHPDPRRALVIGLGTGSTAGWLAALPGMERVDVVELEPAVVRVAEACADVNQRVLERDNVHLIIGDGRELLLTTDRRYDVIFSEPSNPYRAGISSLFTQEFYRAAADRLTDDGLFLQWLQGYEVDAAVVRTAYGTLASVFPSVESWQVGALDLLLVAGEAPLIHDWQRVTERASREPYRSALERVWGVTGAAGFYSGHLAGPGLAQVMSGALEATRQPLNTDDHPVIEYGFVRNLGRRGLFEIDDLVALAERLGVDQPALGPSASRMAIEDAASARGVFLQSVPMPASATEDEGLMDRTLARRAYLDGRLADALGHWESQDQQPKHPADLLLVAESLATLGDPRTPAAVDRLRVVLPTEAEAVLARYRWELGDPPGAVDHLEALFSRLREQPWWTEGSEQRSLELAEEVGRSDIELAQRLYDAAAEPFATGVAETNRRLLRVHLAGSAGFRRHCVEAFRELEPNVPWRGPMLSNRVLCYQENDHPLLDRALEELGDWRSAQPPRLDTGLR